MFLNIRSISAKKTQIFANLIGDHKNCNALIHSSEFSHFSVKQVNQEMLRFRGEKGSKI